MTRRLASLVLALSMAGAAVGCGVVTERPEGYEKRDYIVDPSLRFQQVTLNEIVRNPQEGAFEFDAILNKRDENIWQAYYTPFRPGDFKSFSVWPVDAAVWDANGRGGSIPTLYIATESPQISELYALERYTPVRIRGVVKSNFDSRPWIQVHYVDRIGAPWFTDEALGKLIQGIDEIGKGQARAQSLLDEALDGPLSPAGQAACYKAMGWMHLERKQFSQAHECYLRALDSLPNDPEARDGVWRAKTQKGPAPRGAGAVSGTPGPGAAPASDLRGKYEALLAEHESKCAALAGEHARCADLIKSLGDERDAAVKAHADCAGAKKQVEAKDGEIKGLTERIVALEAERDELKKKGEAGGADSDAMKKAAEAKDAELKALGEKVTALETERDDLKKKVEAGGGDADAMKKAMEAKDAELKTLTEKVAALEAERDELKKKAAEGGGGDAEGMKKQIEAKDAEIKTLNEKVAEAAQQVKDRDETIKKQRDEIDRLTEELKKKEKE